MRRLLSFAIFAVSFVLVLFFSVTGYAQTFRGAINGSVTDPSGAVVAGASVKAANTATGIALSTISTSGGAFAFQDIPPGVYKITVTASGFSTSTVDNVNVVAGSVYTLPVQLKVGQSATVVEVSAAELTVDTTTVTQSDTIPSASLQQIPLNGRDFSQLIAVTPGYGGYSVGGFGSLNGTRANQVNWQVDGTDNNDFWHNIPAINQGGVSGIAGTVLPIDAVDEFSAQTQSNAETGRNAGGTVNLVIKSGTNQLHGSAYYYNRNEFYAATSPFFIATPQFPKAPELRNQNYGFTVGGPIIKDKTFFFLGFEKQNYIFGLTGLSTEPSAAWVAKARGLLTAATPESPVSDSLLAALWPSSIQGLQAITNNYFATVPGTGYSYNEVGKIDHNFNEKALGLFTSPDALRNGQPMLGAPNIAISGFDQVGITPPEGRNDITGHLTDILSYTVGKHQFRIGGEVRQGRVDEFYYRRSLGSFNFTGKYGTTDSSGTFIPGNPWAGTCASTDPTCALADFLAGDVSSSSIAIGRAERQVRVNAFA